MSVISVVSVLLKSEWSMCGSVPKRRKEKEVKIEEDRGQRPCQFDTEIFTFLTRNSLNTVVPQNVGQNGSSINDVKVQEHVYSRV
jgi:hypothetical protein